jgi:ParB family chromosome partitioning protein
MDRFGHTQEKLAEALSKSRSHIANQLRLLNLPVEVQDFLRDGKLTAGHARAMITALDPIRLARDTVSKGLSVREVERLAQKPRDAAPKTPTAPRSKDADTVALENDLSAALGLKVSIAAKGAQSGQVVVAYADFEELDRICQALSNAR